MNAFVLSGGGNLGSIQVGMLLGLLEAGIVPDVIVGTSIGAVNAAFLAADPSVEHARKLSDLWCSVRARDIFPLNPLVVARAVFREGALFPTSAWRRFLRDRIPYERIEDAAIPLFITATDFDEGHSVVLDSGPVVDAVLASTALPTVFPPYRIGDQTYLDGVLSDQVPLKAAINAGADTVYVMAVSVPCPPPDRRSPGGILRHSVTILLFPRIRLDALDLSARHPKLRIVQVPSVATQVSLWDMSRHGDLIQQAYEETTKFLADRERAEPGSDGADADDRTQVASVPEMKVEADIDDRSTTETRSAEADGGDG
jgi:NTE family protein